jgi:hypothetical protein
MDIPNKKHSTVPSTTPSSGDLSGNNSVVILNDRYCDKELSAQEVHQNGWLYQKTWSQQLNSL